ncbi:hypothetical protein M8J75_001257 [Diaphorina citri]|nr:hypothetical protein M8J75_001257 [Diaphorina citri]
MDAITKRALLHADLYFLGVCIKKKLTPNFVKCVVRPKNAKLEADVKRKILVAETNNKYKKLAWIDKKLMLIHIELGFWLHQAEFECLDSRARDQAFLEKSAKMNTLKNKLAYLTKTQPIHPVTPRVPQVEFFKRTLNISDIQLDPKETSLLDMGPKYNPNITPQNKAIEQLKVGVCTGVFNQRLLASMMEDIEAQKQTVIANKTNQEAVKAIQRKLRENNLIITKADKNNTLIIMKADDYDNKIQDFLNTDSIVELNRDPTATLMKNIRQLLTKDNALFQYPMKMYKMNSYPPILYGTLKVHKAGTDGNFASVPIRPVVSGMSSPTYLIEKNIVQLVQSKANWTPTYSVKNSLTLVDKIRNLDIPPNAHLASLDIDNLFSNVDMDMAMHLLHNLVMEHANFTDRQPSYNIAHKLEKNGLKAAFYPLTRLGQTLYNHKNINKMEYSGVYELKCECGAQYIGQTGRSFGARIKEHLAIPKRYAKACRSATEENTPEIEAKYKDKSAMADHLIDSGHNPELYQSKIKHICTIGKRLDILESIEINKIINKPNCLNVKNENTMKIAQIW